MEMALARTNSATMIFALTGGLATAKQVDEKFDAYRPLFDGILKSVSISE